MHSCVAVHAVLSTSADVCVIIKHTAISWTNLPRESNAIAIRLTEAGGQSATTTCTGVLITNTVTVIIPALVQICLVVEAMHSCVAVHVVLSTSADICIIIKHTTISWTDFCSESNAIAINLTETGGQSATKACACVFITNAVTVIIHTLVLVLVLISLVEEVMHSCVAVHAVLSTSADVCIVMEQTVRVCDWTNCCRDGDDIAIILTKTRGQIATISCTGVHISTAVTVIITALILVLITLVGKIMHSCVAVHAILSTSADVYVIIKLTVRDCDWIT